MIPDEKQDDDRPRWRPISRFPGNVDSPTPGAWVDVDFGASSRRGPTRTVNDNHYLVLRLGRHQETLRSSLPSGAVPPRFDEFAYAMVIADGMGREAEAASRLAVATFAHQAVHFGKWNVRVDAPVAEDIMDRATRFFKNVDAALLDAARGNPSGLQTTLTAVLTAGSELFFVNVGNSSVYLFRDGALMPLTRHAEGDTLGVPSLIRPKADVERCGLLDGDIVLLCTNSLTDVVPEPLITETLRLHTTPNDQCRALVDLAARSGSDDDVTTVIGHYHVGATPDTGG